MCARSLVERHRNEEAIDTCKTALEVVSEYKIAGDTMYQQLQGQEKQIRRLLVASKERKKVEKKKEKRRARAMFGVVEEKKDSEKKELTVETTESYPAAKERPPVQPNLVLQTESIEQADVCVGVCELTGAHLCWQARLVSRAERMGVANEPRQVSPA